MYCTNCGKQLPEGSKFCNYCGWKVNISISESSTINNLNNNISSTDPIKKTSFVPFFLLTIFITFLAICVVASDNSDIAEESSYIGCASIDVEEYLKENNINYILSCDYSGDTYIKADTPVIYDQYTNNNGEEEVLELYSALPSVDIEGISYDIDEYDFLSITLDIKNMSDKDIKYVNIDFTVNNAVSDPLENESPFEHYDNLQFIGPLTPGESEEAYWENIFRNPVMKEFVINSVNVIFMDETTQHLDGTYTLTFN